MPQPPPRRSRIFLNTTASKNLSDARSVNGTGLPAWRRRLASEPGADTDDKKALRTAAGRFLTSAEMVE